MNRYIRISVPIILAGILALGSVCVAASSGDTESYDAYNLSAATKQEIDGFLASDNISENVYSWIGYNCLNFAVDLWRNAYLAGLDAFIVVINKDGIFSHTAVGFYEQGDDYPCWSDEDGRYWLYVDPQCDVSFGECDEELLARVYVQSTDDIIVCLYGEDAFNLWQEVSGKTLGIELIRLYRMIWLYKVGKVVATQ